MIQAYYCGFKPIKKWVTTFFLLPLAIYFIANRGHYCFIDNANLVIHEAGHFFFGFTGQFIRAAGGTLMQICFPLFLAWYFFRTGYRTAVQVFVFWLGQNLLNISVYAADAPYRRLHLIGGKHDWYYLLGQLGIRNHAEIVGFLFFGAGIFVFIAAILLPLFLDESNRSEILENI